MSNEDKMLQLVLSDPDLYKHYGFSPDSILRIEDALRSDIPVVVVVAKIIRKLNKNSDKSDHKSLYTELFNYLNGNINEN